MAWRFTVERPVRYWMIMGVALGNDESVSGRHALYLFTSARDCDMAIAFTAEFHDELKVSDFFQIGAKDGINFSREGGLTLGRIHVCATDVFK
ncbi:hypothetical protein [uncultured Tateyamaria sp.]|uniref:hypothetical protein n=1 Tax=uncultured Tateyamaria sp. TaxID=455651 RepID=UPI00260F4E4A|nr:hypothetical protein [uncultured Tateyamaria sp.]